MKAKRQRLSAREFAAMWLKQDAKCACGCGEPLNAREGVIQEHTTPVALGNGEKPDALYRYPCAYKKTCGVRGDLNIIAHVKRIREGRTQFDKRKAAGGSRIQGKGFQGWRKFSGEVVRK